MKIRIRSISSYQPTKEIERRIARLASLILENVKGETVGDQKCERLDKTVSKDVAF